MPDGLNVNDGEFSLSDFSSGEPQKKERVYGCSREEVCLLHIEFYFLFMKYKLATHTYGDIK